MDKEPQNLPEHPHGDTILNKGQGGPPPTWNPGKVTQNADHVYAIGNNDEGRVRWECSCGETGQWGKGTEAERIYNAWLNHVEAE